MPARGTMHDIKAAASAAALLRTPGVVTGGVALLLRAEGAAAFAARLVHTYITPPCG